MTTPKDLIDAAIAFAASEKKGVLSELCGAAVLRGSFDEAGFRRWVELSTEARAFGANVRIYDELGDDVEIRFFEDLDRLHASIAIGLPVSSSTRYFLTIDGMLSALVNDEIPPEITRVLTAEQASPFVALGRAFAPWGLPEPTFEVQAPDVNPRRYVYDLGERAVPMSIGDALLAAPPENPDAAPFRGWQLDATRRLRASLANEVLVADGREKLFLHGPVTVEVDVEESGVVDDRLYGAANDAARWVFVGAQDVHVRHRLFTAELAAAWLQGARWHKGFGLCAPRALEAAKARYGSASR